MNTTGNDKSQSYSNNMDDNNHSTYHVGDMQEETTPHQAKKKKLKFISNKKTKQDMKNESLLVSELFSNPLDFSDE